MIGSFASELTDTYMQSRKLWNDAVSEWIEECKAQDAAEELLYGPEIDEASPDERPSVEP